MNRPRGEDAAGDVELGDLRARASATLPEPVPQVSAALELWDSQDIEMMDLGKQQSKREACSNASFSSLSGDVLLIISLQNIVMLGPLTACCKDVRANLLEQLGSLHGGLKLTRREVSVGLAELIARMPLDWIEVQTTGLNAVRLEFSDLRNGIINPLGGLDRPYPADSDPRLAIVAAPIIRKSNVDRLVIHCGDGRMLDLARSITNQEFWWLQAMPPPTREVAYILVAGLVPAEIGFIFRVSLDGLTPLTSIALAHAEWRRGEQFVYVESARKFAKGIYSRHISMQQPTAMQRRDDTESALGALHRCRRDHSIPAPRWLRRAESPPTPLHNAIGLLVYFRAWLFTDEGIRMLKSCVAFGVVLAVIVVSAVHLTTHATSHDSGVV